MFKTSQASCRGTLSPSFSALKNSIEFVFLKKTLAQEPHFQQNQYFCSWVVLKPAQQLLIGCRIFWIHELANRFLRWAWKCIFIIFQLQAFSANIRLFCLQHIDIFDERSRVNSYWGRAHRKESFDNLAASSTRNRTKCLVVAPTWPISSSMAPPSGNKSKLSLSLVIMAVAQNIPHRTFFTAAVLRMCCARDKPEPKRRTTLHEYKVGDDMSCVWATTLRKKRLLTCSIPR